MFDAGDELQSLFFEIKGLTKILIQGTKWARERATKKPMYTQRTDNALRISISGVIGLQPLIA